jgi:Xaa-Pro dipeptidase
MQIKRLEKAKNRMKETGFDSLIISDPVSVYYLSGLMVHPGERMFALIIEEDRSLLFINRLFPVTIPDDLEPVWYSDTEDPVAILASRLGDTPGRIIGIDKA